MQVVHHEFDRNSPLARGFPLIEPTIAVNPGAGPESPCEITGDPRPLWLTSKNYAKEYRKKKNLDVMLVFDDGILQVHETVIVKYFEPFRDMFKDNRRGYNTVRLFSVNREAAEATFDYLYHGKATVKDRSLPMLLKFIKCMEYPLVFTYNPVKIYLMRNEQEAKAFNPWPFLRPMPPPPPPRRHRPVTVCRATGWGRGRNLFMFRYEIPKPCTRAYSILLQIQGIGRRKLAALVKPLATLKEEVEEDAKKQ